jgi:hypothetical protein
MIIFVRAVMARLKYASANTSFLQVYESIPKLIKVDCPIITCGTGIRCFRRMEWNVNRLSTIERHRWEVLVEIRLKHYDLISFL